MKWKKRINFQRQGGGIHPIRRKKNKKSKDNLRDLQGTMKWTNINITGVPESKQSEKGTENLSEKVMTENFWERK